MPAGPSPASGRGEEPHAERRQVAIVVLLAVVGAGLLWWFDPAEMHLPLCTFHRLTGLDCPGCGATRATHELLHGRIQAAWRENALWVLLLPALLYAAAGELWMLAGGRRWPGELARRRWFWTFVVAAAAIFFVARNLWVLT
jgi:hypothetical protein